MGALRNILFLVFVFCIFYSIELFKDSGKNHIQVQMSRQTLYNLLESAKEDISKHYFKNASHHIELSVKYLRHVEESFDKSTNSVLDSAIDDLELVLQDIENKVIYEDELNESFAKAMSALALAHLTVCEQELEEGKIEDALKALKHSINHLNHARKYSSGDLLQAEVELIEELVELSASGSVTKSSIHTDVEKIRNTIIMAK